MSFLSTFYDGVLNLIVDNEKKNQQDNKANGEPFVCKECDKICNMTCTCRCHSPSCEECDKSNCDLKSCSCRCHVITEPAVTPADSHTPKEKDVPKPESPFLTPSPPVINNPEPLYFQPPPTEVPTTIVSFKLIKTPPQSKPIAPNTPIINKLNKEEEIKTPKPFVSEPNPRKNISKSQPEDTASSNSNINNRRASLTKPVKQEVVEEEEEKEEKKDMTMRRTSKYSAVLTKGNEVTEKKGGVDIFKNVRGRSNVNQTKKIIVFRSKSKEKKETRAKNEKLESKDDPQYLKSKNIPLNLRLKAQFERVKLSDLKVPDKLDNYVDEKFIRDKSEITKNMEKLTRELKQDNYSDKEKLALNIFEDFEKQESWQSYTTLLFADLTKVEQANEIKDKKRNDNNGGQNVNNASIKKN